ncbi:hypothetical protein JZ751_003291 [Albula glossodonta]|uniref:Uncharacterized protein n=1 Tax=Albula glossodonta TaxID=121402 RepID=A0A8T2NEB1_9TELE|nr:hypothetical protein JZ751_003291 [Albula glossodonta]
MSAVASEQDKADLYQDSISQVALPGQPAPHEQPQTVFVILDPAPDSLNLLRWATLVVYTCSRTGCSRDIVYYVSSCTPPATEFHSILDTRQPSLRDKAEDVESLLPESGIVADIDVENILSSGADTFYQLKSQPISIR